MEYTIGEVSKLTKLSISTLRYYDKQGLIKNINRTSNIRKFSLRDLNTIQMIECLKRSNMSLDEIKQFMDLCEKGNQSLKERYQIFIEREKKVKKQIKELEESLELIKFKQWYYQTALEHQDENYVKDIPLDDMPETIRKYYEDTHYLK